MPHRAVVRLVINTNYVDLTSEDRIAQVSTVCFDAATFEIWGALLNGAALIVHSANDSSLATRLCKRDPGPEDQHALPDDRTVQSNRERGARGI